MDESEENMEPMIGTLSGKGKSTKRGFSPKSLLQDLLSKKFNEEMACRIVTEYQRVAAGRNFQHTRRKGLLFACALSIYKVRKQAVDLLSVMTQMEIKNGIASKGIRLYEELLKESGLPVERLECTSIEYVELLTSQLAVTKGWCTLGHASKETEITTKELDMQYACRCIESILDYLSKREVRSTIKSSTPGCIAAASIYFHFVASGYEINKEFYANLCGCSVASIEKLHDDIASALRSLVTCE